MPLSLRIIRDPGRPAWFNMAADLRLMSRCVEEQSVFLRLYRWHPPALSLGFMQDVDATVDHEALRRRAVACIRRPTGGRAVLHDDDITYSCIFPVGSPGMGTTIAETYHVISRCLTAGLARCGIVVEAHDTVLDSAEVRREIKLPCFLASNREELMAGGKKLAGSAQKRTDKAVLQHGSLPFGGAFRELPSLLNIPRRQRQLQRELLHRKCACIRDLNADVDKDTVEACLSRGFAEILGIDPGGPDVWSADEEAEVERFGTSEEFMGRWLPETTVA